MGDTTGIAWTDHTFNPWLGCSEVSPGCGHCYAHTLVSGRMGEDVWRDKPRRRTVESNWRKPLKWARDAADRGSPALVFCASLADVFEDRPELEPWREDLFKLMAATYPWLIWQVLTKRPEVARRWILRRLRPFGVGQAYGEENGLLRVGDGLHDEIPWPLPNVWLGTSIENPAFTWRADELRRTPVALRFLSCEPLLASLYPRPRPLHHVLPPDAPLAREFEQERARRAALDLDGIGWVIVGGESGGRDARPMHPAWAREIRDRCAAERIPFFFKQQGSWKPTGVEREIPPMGLISWEDGRRVRRAIDGTGGVSVEMFYAGAAPDSGGHLLDGVEHREFPVFEVVRGVELVRGASGAAMTRGGT